MARENVITRRKPNSRHRRRRIVLIVALIFIVIVTAIGVVIFLNRDAIFHTSNNMPANTENNPSSNSQSEDNKNNDSKNNQESSDTREQEKSSISQYSGENPNNLDAITGTISSAGVTDGTLIIRVMLDQSLGGSGTCNFTLTHTSGKTITGSANTEATPSATFCIYSTSAAGISTGHWQITASVEASNKRGIINGEVDL